MKNLTLILLLFSSLAVAQGKITGHVVDKITQGGISFANVYFNGTTKGTVTDEQGYFELVELNVPFQLVVSHVGYPLMVMDNKKIGHEPLFISLKAKDINLRELEVKGKNLRGTNVNRFTRAFIGNDTWGQSATLLNDSVLSFEKTMVKDTLSTIIKRRNGESKDTTFISTREKEFRTFAHAPLIIDLPALGYTLHTNLMYFSISDYKQRKRTSSLGYYYFQEKEIDNKHKAKRVDYNRRKAYYQSPMHFCRSLIDRSLPENGYALFKEVQDPTRKKELQPINIDSCLVSFNEQLTAIVGLKGEPISIIYFHKYNGMPRNLKEKKAGNVYSTSKVYFISDTCLISNEGIVPGNNIIFSGMLSKKKAGAKLPANYNPERLQE